MSRIRIQAHAANQPWPPGSTQTLWRGLARALSDTILLELSRDGDPLPLGAQQPADIQPPVLMLADCSDHFYVAKVGPRILFIPSKRSTRVCHFPESYSTLLCSPLCYLH